MSIENKIIDILIKLIDDNGLKKVKSSEIVSSTSLTNDLGLDSLNLAELTVIIESEFGIDIFEKEIIRTYGDIIKVLR